jgi:hypothetical protein
MTVGIAIDNDIDNGIDCATLILQIGKRDVR